MTINVLVAAALVSLVSMPASSQLAASPALRQAAALASPESAPAPAPEATPLPAGLREFSCRGDRMRFRNGLLDLRFIGAGGGVQVRIGGDFGPQPDFQQMLDAMGGHANPVTVAWARTACSTDSTDSLLLRCEGTASLQVFDEQGAPKNVMVEALLHFDRPLGTGMTRRASMTVLYDGHLYQENVDFPKGRCSGDAS